MMAGFGLADCALALEVVVFGFDFNLEDLEKRIDGVGCTSAVVGLLAAEYP